MIPYEELVAALASWRARQGLPSGPADYLGEPEPVRYDYAPAEAQPAAAGYSEDVVELSDDMMDSVVEEQSYTVEAEEPLEYATHSDSDTQDEDIDSYLDRAMPSEPTIAEPEPEPEPEAPPEPSGGRRKRKR